MLSCNAGIEEMTELGKTEQTRVFNSRDNGQVLSVVAVRCREAYPDVAPTCQARVRMGFLVSLRARRCLYSPKHFFRGC
jgi:hypothetical protein